MAQRRWYVMHRRERHPGERDQVLFGLVKPRPTHSKHHRVLPCTLSTNMEPTRGSAEKRKIDFQDPSVRFHVDRGAGNQEHVPGGSRLKAEIQNGRTLRRLGRIYGCFPPKSWDDDSPCCTSHRVLFGSLHRPSNG